MTAPQELIRMLEEMTDLAYAKLCGGKGSETAVVKASTRNACVLGFCLSLAGQTCDHWDLSALRDALRDIAVACQWALDEQQAALDGHIVADTKGMAKFLDLPEDATAEDIMIELGKRQQDLEDDGRDIFRGPREKEPT